MIYFLCSIIVIRAQNLINKNYAIFTNKSRVFLKEREVNRRKMAKFRWPLEDVDKCFNVTNCCFVYLGRLIERVH